MGRQVYRGTLPVSLLQLYVPATLYSCVNGPFQKIACTSRSRCWGARMKAHRLCCRLLPQFVCMVVAANAGIIWSFFSCCSRSASALESWIFSHMCKYSVIMLWPSKSHIINTVAPFVNGSAASLFSFLPGSCGFAFVHVAFAPCRYMSKKVSNSDNVYASAHTCINTMYRLDSFSLAYTIPLRTL